MREWETTTLTELCTTITYGYTASANLNGIGPKFVRITDIVPSQINWDSVPNCVANEKDIEKYKLREGDIVIARTGATTGYNKYIKKLKHEALFASYLIRYQIDTNKAFPEFVGHILQSSNWYDYVDAIAGGSAQPGANAKQLGSFELNLPPIEEQKTIASVLSSLDDKIDLLHRQNTTLERMAETLFRQWFIEEGQEDWEAGKLSDVSDNIRQSVQAKDIQATTKYIGLEHIDRRNIALKKYGIGEDVSSNKYAFEKNDILFGKLRPYFHKVCFSPFFGICSTDILVIRPKSPDYFAFCLFAYFQNDVVEYANLGSGGTRMPRTDWETLKQYPVSLPDKETLLKFNAIVVPSLNKITENLVQIQTLEKLRNSLLPKLMSGEVRVSA